VEISDVELLHNVRRNVVNHFVQRHFQAQMVTEFDQFEDEMAEERSALFTVQRKEDFDEMPQRRKDGDNSEELHPHLRNVEQRRQSFEDDLPYWLVGRYIFEALQCNDRLRVDVILTFVALAFDNSAICDRRDEVDKRFDRRLQKAVVRRQKQSLRFVKDFTM
jgi:hypothetical protein